MMFNRKVLLTALMAVLLLGSPVDAGVEAVASTFNKSMCAVIQAGIKPEEVSDVILGAISLPSILNKAASSISPVDPSDRMTYLKDRKPRRPRSLAGIGVPLDPAQSQTVAVVGIEEYGPILM